MEPAALADVRSVHAVAADEAAELKRRVQLLLTSFSRTTGTAAPSAAHTYMPSAQQNSCSVGNFHSSAATHAPGNPQHAIDQLKEPHVQAVHHGLQQRHTACPLTSSCGSYSSSPVMPWDLPDSHAQDHALTVPPPPAISTAPCSNSQQHFALPNKENKVAGNILCSTSCLEALGPQHPNAPVFPVASCLSSTNQAALQALRRPLQQLSTNYQTQQLQHQKPTATTSKAPDSLSKLQVNVPGFLANPQHRMLQQQGQHQQQEQPRTALQEDTPRQGAIERQQMTQQLQQALAPAVLDTSPASTGVSNASYDSSSCNQSDVLPATKQTLMPQQHSSICVAEAPPPACPAHAGQAGPAAVELQQQARPRALTLCLHSPPQLGCSSRDDILQGFQPPRRTGHNIGGAREEVASRSSAAWTASSIEDGLFTHQAHQDLCCQYHTSHSCSLLGSTAPCSTGSSSGRASADSSSILVRNAAALQQQLQSTETQLSLQQQVAAAAPEATQTPQAGDSPHVPAAPAASSVCSGSNSSASRSMSRGTGRQDITTAQHASQYNLPLASLANHSPCSQFQPPTANKHQVVACRPSATPAERLTAAEVLAGQWSAVSAASAAANRPKVSQISPRGIRKAETGGHFNTQQAKLQLPNSSFAVVHAPALGASPDAELSDKTAPVHLSAAAPYPSCVVHTPAPCARRGVFPAGDCSAGAGGIMPLAWQAAAGTAAAGKPGASISAAAAGAGRQFGWACRPWGRQMAGSEAGALTASISQAVAASLPGGRISDALQGTARIAAPPRKAHAAAGAAATPSCHLPPASSKFPAASPDLPISTSSSTAARVASGQQLFIQHWQQRQAAANNARSILHPFTTSSMKGAGNGNISSHADGDTGGDVHSIASHQSARVDVQQSRHSASSTEARAGFRQLGSSSSSNGTIAKHAAASLAASAGARFRPLAAAGDARGPVQPAPRMAGERCSAVEWAQWKQVAGSMLQAAPRVDAGVASSVPKLPGTAIPPFLQQHAAMVSLTARQACMQQQPAHLLYEGQIQAEQVPVPQQSTHSSYAAARPTPEQILAAAQALQRARLLQQRCASTTNSTNNQTTGSAGCGAMGHQAAEAAPAATSTTTSTAAAASAASSCESRAPRHHHKPGCSLVGSTTEQHAFITQGGADGAAVAAPVERSAVPIPQHLLQWLHVQLAELSKHYAGVAASNNSCSDDNSFPGLLVQQQGATTTNRSSTSMKVGGQHHSGSSGSPLSLPGGLMSASGPQVGASLDSGWATSSSSLSCVRTASVVPAAAAAEAVSSPADSLADTAQSRLIRTHALPQHLLLRTPYVGVRSGDVDYIAQALRDWHGRQNSQDLMYVRHARSYHAERAVKARRRLGWRQQQLGEEQGNQKPLVTGLGAAS